ncbi:hypothetical protein D9M71_829200 [compost metagenome]
MESQKPVRQQIEQLERRLGEVNKASERAWQERTPSGEVPGVHERAVAEVRQLEKPAPVARETAQNAPEQAEPVRDEPEQLPRQPLSEPDMDWDEDEPGMDMD